MDIDSDKIAKFLDRQNSPEGQGGSGRGQITVEVMVNLAVNLWRLERAISLLGLEPDTSEMKRILRHMKAAIEDLKEAGFAFEDLDGKRVPAAGNYALKTMEFVPTQGLEFDTVLETIKPNVFYQGELIHPGEGIVGIPVKGDDEESAKEEKDQ